MKKICFALIVAASLGVVGCRDPRAIDAPDVSNVVEVGNSMPIVNVPEPDFNQAAIANVSSNATNSVSP